MKNKRTSYDYVDLAIGLNWVGFVDDKIEVTLINRDSSCGEEIVIGSDTASDYLDVDKADPKCAIESAICSLQLAITRLQALKKKRDIMQIETQEKINEEVRKINYEVLTK